MKIRALISTSTFPVQLDDGLPRFVYDLASELTRHCDVEALVPGAPGARRRERMGSVDVRRFTYFRPRRWQSLAYGHGIRENLRGSILPKLQLLPYVCSQVGATRALVRERQIHVVNSHWMIPQGLSSALARGRSRRFQHVLTLHSGDVYMLRKLPWGRQLARFVLGRTDFVFAVATNVRSVLDELLGYSSNAEIQPVGVQVDLFSQGGRIDSRDSPFPDGHLVFVGRLHEIKGVDYLLEAMPAVLRRHPGLGLIIVGYGPRAKALRHQAEFLGIGPAVQFAGRQPHGEIVRYLRSCRLAVVPSVCEEDGRTEGMPTVVLEAMASGARVVASAVGGIRDVIRHGENGWLCRPRDPEDLADKILAALQDPPSSAVVRSARKTAESFDWSAVAARYAEVFERLVTTPSHEK